MAIFEIQTLDSVPTAAAARFYSHYLPMIALQIEISPPVLTILFPDADHTHHSWRLAAIQALARESVPSRVNGIAGNDGPAQLAAVRYLETAPGLTGQYFPLDGAGAGPVIQAAR